MERLTDKITNIENGNVLSYRLKREFDSLKGIQKLGAYEDAEEQGLLLRIECHCKDCKYVNFDGCLNTTCYCRKNGCFMQMDDFCKYATKEEAEQALKQMGE